jgi:hypothetical protein
VGIGFGATTCIETRVEVQATNMQVLCRMNGAFCSADLAGFRGVVEKPSALFIYAASACLTPCDETPIHPLDAHGLPGSSEARV